MTIYEWLDAWFSTAEGQFWASVAGFVAVSLIPVMMLAWALVASARARRAAKRRRIAHEVREALAHEYQPFTGPLPSGPTIYDTLKRQPK